MVHENKRRTWAEAYHPRYPPGKIHIHRDGTNRSMHAEKIRTANLPSFRLSPKDAVIILSLIGIGAYILGFFVGLSH